MIISHKYQYIFLKTRKTAGTSFEIALSKYLSPIDVVTPISAEDEKLRMSLGHAGPQNYVIDPGTADGDTVAFYNHIPARKVKAFLGKKLFNQYVKVAIIRNPFDVAVSGYFWVRRGQPNAISVDDFRTWLLTRLNVNKNRRITHLKGRSVVDCMIQFEQFERDVGAFAERVGLPSTLFQEMRAIKAKSSYRPAEMTTRYMFADFPEGRQRIEKIFSREIEKYGYNCD